MIKLKFKTEIKGTSDTENHQDWIELTSIRMNCGRHFSVLSGGADRETNTPYFDDIECNKDFDIASSELFFQSIAGKSLEEAEFHFMQTSAGKANQVYLKIWLTDPIVTSFRTVSSGERPSETFTLNYTQIKVQYFEFDGEKVKSGDPKGWNLKTGLAWTK